LRLIVADWGTSRFRAYLVDGGTILERVSSPEGIASLAPGQHREVFRRHCGPWLAREPEAPVLLVGMVGSREGWAEAPYVACPADAVAIARAMIPVDLGEGRSGYIVPGLFCEPAPGAADVLRGEETLALGADVETGLVCLPGTHSKWVEVLAGRIERFATYMTGEMYALLREHSMIGRPATEPADPAGFARGLEAARRNGAEHRVGLLHLLFGARAAVVSGRMASAALGPYLSGLLTGDEVQGALAQFGKPPGVTIVAGPDRAELYVEALARHGVRASVLEPEAALMAGLARLAAHRPAATAG
jgi:2-dehydro-3-deoxygalactonokinase